MAGLPDPSTYDVKHTEAGTLLIHKSCGMALAESNVLPGWAVFYCTCRWHQHEMEYGNGRL